jgi:hypothetical protein
MNGDIRSSREGGMCTGHKWGAQDAPGVFFFVICHYYTNEYLKERLHHKWTTPTATTTPIGVKFDTPRERTQARMRTERAQPTCTVVWAVCFFPSFRQIN